MIGNFFALMRSLGGIKFQPAKKKGAFIEGNYDDFFSVFGLGVGTIERGGEFRKSCGFLEIGELQVFPSKVA